MFTNIMDINNDMEKQKVILTQDSLYDFTLSNIDRLAAVHKYIHTRDELIEFFQKIDSSTMFVKSSETEEFINMLVNDKTLDLDCRCDFAKNACDDKNSIFLLCRELEADVEKKINTLKKLDFLLLLIKKMDDDDVNILKLFINFISNQTIDCLFRYKCIAKLDNQFCKKKSLLAFLEDQRNNISERILSAQLLLTQFTEKSSIKYLLQIAENDTNNHNNRADCVDIVLKFGDENEKTRAKEILNDLSRIGEVEDKHIYQNAQNAHVQEIEQSAIRICERLIQSPLLTIRDKVIDFEYVKNFILNDTDITENIQFTLNRIELDSILYTHYNISLKMALTYMFSFIFQHDDRDILLVRLMEELESAREICSSGIFERIMNTTSGIVEGMEIKIGFEDQIYSNLYGRLNARIAQILEEECYHKNIAVFCDCINERCVYSLSHKKKGLEPCKQCCACKDVKCVHVCPDPWSCNKKLFDKITSEMIVDCSKYAERQHFLKYFGFVLADIGEEMKEEFKEYISETTFDMYMKKAIMKYQGDI